MLDIDAQKIYEDVQKRIGEGYESIQYAEKAIFFLGMTGAGKTTTVCLLA